MSAIKMIKGGFQRIALGLTLLVSLFAQPCRAGNILDFNLLDPNNLNGVVPQDVADELIKMYALWGVHRAYSGATAITSSERFSLHLETTLVKLSDGLTKALAANGITYDQSKYYPAVPAPKLNLRFGFSEGFDMGVSGLYYRGQALVGADLNFVLHDAEEGPSFSLRLGATYFNAPYLYVKNVIVVAPEFVVSRKLSFAEPYIGIGGRYYKGSVEIPFAGAPPVVPAFSVTKDSHGTDGYAFTGLYFRVFSPGIRLGIEGSYSLAGFHTVGTKFGFGF